MFKRTLFIRTKQPVHFRGSPFINLQDDIIQQLNELKEFFI